MILPLVLLWTAAQRPGPGGNPNTCVEAAEGDAVPLGCAPGGNITSFTFAEQVFTPLNLPLTLALSGHR